MRPISHSEETAPGGSRRKAAASRNKLVLKHTLVALVSLLLYLLLNRSNVIVETQLGYTLWYPPAGLALALMLGISPWYALLVAFGDALSGVLIYHQTWTSWGTVIGSSGMAGTYAIAAIILRGRLRIDLGLSYRRDVTRFVFVTLGTAICSTAIGVGCLVADDSIPWSRFLTAAVDWVGGDSIAFVGVAPFLLMHVLPPIRRWLLLAPAEASQPIAKPRTRPSIRLGNMAEALGQIASILLVLWAMFAPPFAPAQLFYLSFVPMIWVAMRHGIKHVTSAILLFNFGVVVALRFYPPSLTLLPKVGLLMFVVSFTGLILGSAVSERQRIAKELSKQTTYLNSLIENTPLGVVVLDQNDHVNLCNDAFENLFLFEREELIGKGLDAKLSPAGDTTDANRLTAQLAAGQRVHQSARRVRKDGRLIDVDIHAVPVMLAGEVRGSLVIYADISEQIQARQQTKEHAASLARLVLELQVRSAQMALLSELADLLQYCASVEEAYMAVAGVVPKLLPTATSGILYVFKSSRNVVEAAATWGQPPISETKFAPAACWGLRLGEPYWSDCPTNGIICQHLRQPLSGKYLCVPMVGQGETLGVLHLEFVPRLESNVVLAGVQDSLQRLAATVAGQIALSLANLRLRATLRDQSIRDALTGLFNRRFMEESLDRELQRATRKRRSLAVLFLDLDHFKQFNDTFGHDAGDAVLRRMAELFRQHFRGDDVICRYGGEEFAIILPESSAIDAARRADLLRGEARRIEIRHRGQVLNPVTFSVGVAAFPENGVSADEILRAADQSLYQSKVNGRDRATIAVPQIVS
jgi:diguanylate cyclase (GGDEF)-like protein/PAS domain S-box-containing protein